MTEDEVLEAFRKYQATGDRRLRNELVEQHRGIAVACAKRFRDRGEPLDDLVQVGLLGLVKAVERFDADNGTPFAGFAVPTITGELRRHFRDATWSVHVPRRMKEVAGSIAPAAERLRERLGRHPTVDELAAELQVSPEDVISGMEASAAYKTSALPSERSDGRPAHEPGSPDIEFDRAEARLAVSRMMATLPERERTILYLRFFEEKSQSEIAAVVGTSQVHVSRLIRATLSTLRSRSDIDEPIVNEGDPA